SSGPLTLNIAQRTASISNQTLELTTTEFDLLACLVKASPKPITAQKLVEQALGYGCENIEAREIIKWHIHHLRRKVEPERKPHYIKTVRHKGYMWINA
ncbi:MAG: winged helix-turn-helix domain-containing protein, partial [Chloroflexota bacterium]